MTRSENDIRAVVESCLEQSYRAESPVLSVAECVEKLHSEGWELKDIRRVEQLVLKVLSALSSPKNERTEPDYN